jgi:hypothetical protein
MVVIVMNDDVWRLEMVIMEVYGVVVEAMKERVLFKKKVAQATVFLFLFIFLFFVLVFLCKIQPPFMSVMIKLI